MHIINYYWFSLSNRLFTDMSNILIVSNKPSNNTIILQESVATGCIEMGCVNKSLRVKDPWDSCVEDVLWCDGIIIGTTENFGYMSGAIKDFFERIYYPCLERTQALPVAVYVKGGLDGQGAKISIEKILIGLKWRLIQPTLVLKGDFTEEFRNQCKRLGMTMAAGLEAGIY